MKKYAIGDWYHLFEPGNKETRCRITIDLEQSKLVAAQEWTGLKFEDVLGDRLKNLSESVIEVNQAHANVEEWAPDLGFADELPEWVSPRNLLRNQKIPPMAFASLGSMMLALNARRLVGSYFKQRKSPPAREACRDWVCIYRDSRFLRIKILS